MKTIKTARGKTLNMAPSQVFKNEDVRAHLMWFSTAMVILLIALLPAKVTKERVLKEYYRDNPQGVEEEVSIKADEIET